MAVVVLWAIGIRGGVEVMCVCGQDVAKTHHIDGLLLRR